MYSEYILRIADLLLPTWYGMGEGTKGYIIVAESRGILHVELATR